MWSLPTNCILTSLPADIYFLFFIFRLVRKEIWRNTKPIKGSEAIVLNTVVTFLTFSASNCGFEIESSVFINNSTIPCFCFDLISGKEKTCMCKWVRVNLIFSNWYFCDDHCVLFKYKCRIQNFASDLNIYWGSTYAVSLYLISRELPNIILSPITGVVADTFDRKKIIFVTEFARIFIVLGFVLTQYLESAALLFLFSFLQLSGEAFITVAFSGLVNKTFDFKKIHFRFILDAGSCSKWEIDHHSRRSLGNNMVNIVYNRNCHWR